MKLCGRCLSAYIGDACPCAAYEDLRIGPPDTCPICGTPWTEHDGPTRLCQQLDAARSARDALGRQCKEWEARTEVNAELWREVVAERDALRAALEAVEWCNGKKMSSKDHYITKCPWCLRVRKDSHAPDCARQRALGIAP